MLLHATVVILFGTSHGGGSRAEGEPDVLDVRFRADRSLLDPSLRSGSGAPTASGQALLRPADALPAEPAQAVPDSARPIEANKTPVETPREPTPSRNQAAPEAAAPTPSQAVEPLPKIDLRAPQEVDKPLVTPLVTPPPLERLAPAPSPAGLAAPFEVAPRAEPPPAAPAIDRLAVPPPPRELASPPELAPRVAPALPAAPIERLDARTATPELAPPVELAPRAAPVVPEAAIDRLAAPAAAHSLDPAVELRPPAQAVVPLPLDRLSPPRVDRTLEAAPAVAAPTPRAPASESPVPGVAQPAIPASAAPQPAAAATTPGAAEPNPAPTAAPAAEPKLPRLRLGAPPAPDEDMFRLRRDVVSPADESGGLRIDREAAQQRAREIASEGGSTRGILPALPPPPDRKSKESSALEKAVKPDCRTAYAGLGLLAVPVLVASTIGDVGCHW